MESLTDLLPNTINFSRDVYKSSIFQPERLSISSQDAVAYEVTESLYEDPPVAANTSLVGQGAGLLNFYYSNFAIRLAKPLINLKSVQLIRASIPTPVPNINDLDTVFYYYRTVNTAPGQILDLSNNLLCTFDANGTYTSAPPIDLQDTYIDFEGNIRDISSNNIEYNYNLVLSISGDPVEIVTTANLPSNFKLQLTGPQTLRIPRGVDLHWVRLLPSDYSPELVGMQYGYNRQFTDYLDLLDELNRACLYDPVTSLAGYNGNSITGGTNPPLRAPSFIPGDISFGFDQRFNKFYFTGLTPGWFYLPLSYNDEKMNFAWQQVPRITMYPNTLPLYGQQCVRYRCLNMRLGWTWNNGKPPLPIYGGKIPFNAIVPPVAANITPFQTLFRPVALNGVPAPPFPWASQALFTNYADSPANLVNTSLLYIYMDFILGSSLTSSGDGNLLSVVPLNTANNGVGFYNNTISTPLTKVPQHVQDILITIKDEQGDDFFFPNSVILNLELKLEYE